MSQPAADALTTDMRSLFRDSEARAARLRLLIQAGRDLAAAEGGELDAALATAARGAPGMRLELWSRRNPDAQSGEGDADALRLLAEMIEARLTVRFQHAS